MSKPSPIQLDVRPLMAAKRPPLPAILAAVQQLQPGQDLRLIAPFEPVPLYDLLGAQGFAHEAKEREPGVWEILFSRQGG